MKSQFRHVALIGKYHAQGSRSALEDIANFLGTQGCDVAIEQDTASNTGLTQFPTLDAAGIGAHCDLALVVGGDGTMLGIGRRLAEFGIPLVGINQGRLGFITDIAFEDYQNTLIPMLRGEYEEDRRWMMQAKVVRDGRCVFSATAMNDVVVNRGALPAWWNFA
jgi:NAD+ kinase